MKLTTILGLIMASLLYLPVSFAGTEGPVAKKLKLDSKALILYHLVEGKKLAAADESKEKDDGDKEEGETGGGDGGGKHEDPLKDIHGGGDGGGRFEEPRKIGERIEAEEISNQNDLEAGIHWTIVEIEGESHYVDINEVNFEGRKERALRLMDDVKKALDLLDKDQKITVNEKAHVLKKLVQATSFGLNHLLFPEKDLEAKTFVKVEDGQRKAKELLEKTVYLYDTREFDAHFENVSEYLDRVKAVKAQ